MRPWPGNEVEYVVEPGPGWIARTGLTFSNVTEQVLSISGCCSKTAYFRQVVDFDERTHALNMVIEEEADTGGKYRIDL